MQKYKEPQSEYCKRTPSWNCRCGKPHPSGVCVKHSKLLLDGLCEDCYREEMVKKIYIKGSSKFALVDTDNLEKLSQFDWKLDVHGYAITYAYNRCLRMHLMVLNPFYDYSFEIDHVDGNTLNNTRSNLRACDRVQNCQNRKKSKANKSGYKGVFKNKQTKKWRSSIVYNKVRKHIGYFDTKEEAARAYDEYAKKYFGEFARTNFGHRPC